MLAAWTDRIFFRGSVPTKSALEPPRAAQLDDVIVTMTSPSDYGACMDICESDHKPVFANLSVRLPGYTQVRVQGQGKGLGFRVG